MRKRRISFCVSASTGLNEEQQHIQEMALSFAKNEMAPNMALWDEKVKSTVTSQSKPLNTLSFKWEHLPIKPGHEIPP